MFSKKKEPAPRKGGGDKLMAQMGLTDPSDMSSMDAIIYGDDDDDELEAELAALQKDSTPQLERSSPKKVPVGIATLDRMIAQSLKDVPDSDEDVSDIDDPELLAELHRLSSHVEDEPMPPSPAHVPQMPQGQSTAGLIEERYSMYYAAFENAKSGGDSSRARRLERGLKTLQDLLRKARSGRPVSEDDIPPAVALTSAKPTPTSSPLKEHAPGPAPSPPMILPTVASASAPSPAKEQLPSPSSPQHPSSPPGESRDTRQLLTTRFNQYKTAALAAKKSGNNDQARQYIKIAKQFEAVVHALDEGQPIDLSQMPPPPPEIKGGETASAMEISRSQGSSVPPTADPPMSEAPLPELTQEDKTKLFNAPSEARTVLEALQQRLDKYRTSADQAKAEGNSSKARRMGRIVKQYEDAVKAHRAGRHVDYEELPTPPGFPPIPAARTPKKPPPTPSPLMSPSTSAHQLSPHAESAPSLPSTAPQQNKPVPLPRSPQPHRGQATRPPPVQKQASLLSRSEQQQMYLEERQLAFKKAALKAKQGGDLELAKKYLRQAMGLNQMIEATKSGLPVDLNQVPSMPGSDVEQFVFVNAEDAQAPQGDREQMYKKLEQDLITQIKTCSTNSDHFTRLGDVGTASKFDKMGANARKDLDALKNAYKHGDPVPRFHYEARTYTLVKTCSELGDNDLELTLVRGINYGLPNDYAPGDLDTYIKYEMPYPNEDPQKGYCDTVKGSNSPEYNQSFRLNVARKSRSFLRIIKSKSIKLEIYYKRGFFKGDKVLGTVSIKLQPLENVCELHESYNLQDNRKAVGGKLEVKLRIRDPFIGKQVEEVKEKWLMIDYFERSLPTQNRQTNALPSSSSKGTRSPVPQARPGGMPYRPADQNQHSHSSESTAPRAAPRGVQRDQGKLVGGMIASRSPVPQARPGGVPYRPADQNQHSHSSESTAPRAAPRGVQRDQGKLVGGMIASGNVPSAKHGGGRAPGRHWAATPLAGLAPPPPAPVNSMEVLKYEKQLLDRQIQQMAGRLSRSQEDAMRQRSQMLAHQAEETRDQLKRGGVRALQDYITAMERLKTRYAQEAQLLQKQGNREKAQIFLTKRNLVDKEVEVIRSTLVRS